MVAIDALARDFEETGVELAHRVHEARTSSHVALRLATRRPSGVSWEGERERVKPIAGADRLTLRVHRTQSSSLAGPSNARSPMTNVRIAE